jgi:hypothetical protein
MAWLLIHPPVESSDVHGLGKRMSVGPVVKMSVDYQGMSGSPSEQVQLIVDGEVIKESEAKYDVVLLQVHVTDVRL